MVSLVVIVGVFILGSVVDNYVEKKRKENKISKRKLYEARNAKTQNAEAKEKQV